MSKRMKIIFTLSLLLNIVFIGVGAGLFYRFCQDVPIPRSMSPEGRHFITRTFQEGREQVKPLIEEVKTRRAAVEEIITAEEFDPEAYNAAASQMLDTRDKISRERAKIMGKALVELPAKDRIEFADRILDGLEGRRPHKKGYHGKMMKDGMPPAAATESKP